MKNYHPAYRHFVKWVQEDMNKARILINRKVFSVVFWCLVAPAVLSLVLYGLRRFQLLQQFRFADTLLFLPSFIYALFSLWPTLRDVPRVFKIGGLGAILEESAKEVEWREMTAARLQTEVKLSPQEWNLIDFHLEQDLRRLAGQNRYMAILSAVVFFFMYQFLDLGGAGEVFHEHTPLGVMASWVDQFSQWGTQIFAILLFSSLFYLSGMQLQKHVIRYQACVKRLARGTD